MTDVAHLLSFVAAVSRTCSAAAAAAAAGGVLAARGRVMLLRSDCAAVQCRQSHACPAQISLDYKSSVREGMGVTLQPGCSTGAGGGGGGEEGAPLQRRAGKQEVARLTMFKMHCQLTSYGRARRLRGCSV